MKQILTTLLLINSLSAMEKQIIQREPREWNAQEYDEGNTIQTNAFLHFLHTNKIQTEERTILDVGCGTGKIIAQLAQKSIHIHGFDASKNMIDFAQNKYGHINNLSFEHCFAEDFQSQTKYPLVLMSFCFHFIENKKEALHRISDGLAPDGELFATVTTKNNPTPPSVIAGKKAIQTMKHLFSTEDIQKIAGGSYPSHEELQNMIKDAGLEIITCEEQSFSEKLSTDELIFQQKPIIYSRPGIKDLPDISKKEFFDEYIKYLIPELGDPNTGELFRKICVTIVHARKIKK